MPSLGITVASRRSPEDSSETNETEPVEDAAEELESVPLPASMVEFTRGRPISWKEFIELKPDSSSAELLAIIISLIRSMLALCRWLIRCEPELLLVVLLLLLPGW